MCVCASAWAREAHCVQKLPSTQWVIIGNVQYVCVFGRFHQPVCPASAALEMQVPVACKRDICGNTLFRGALYIQPLCRSGVGAPARGGGQR